MNKFQFMGRLCKDPEIRYSTTNNNKVGLINLAVNRRYVSPGQERQTDFFNLTAFGKTAEFLEKYTKLGQQILVEGRMQNRTWEDKNGQKRYTIDFIVEQVYFADSNRSKEEATIDDFITVDDSEELPF